MKQNTAVMSDLTVANKQLFKESDAQITGWKSRFIYIDTNVCSESCDAEKNLKKKQTEPDCQLRERWVFRAVTPTSTVLHFNKKVKPSLVTPTNSSKNTLKNRSIELHSDEQVRSQNGKSALYTPQIDYSPQLCARRLGSAIKSKNATMMKQPAKRIPIRHQPKGKMETTRADTKSSSLRAGISSPSRKSFIPQRQHYYTKSKSKKENEIIPITPSPRNNQQLSFSFEKHRTCSTSKRDRFRCAAESVLVHSDVLVHSKSSQKKMHLTRGAVRVKSSAQKM